MVVSVGYVRRSVVVEDGRSLNVLDFIPASRTTAVTVVFLPAMGVPIEYYEPLLEAWSQRGRRIYGVQTRQLEAQGAGRRRYRDFGYQELIRHDLPAVLGAGLIDDAPVLVGHSLGGQIALLATSISAARPRAVITIASGTSSLRTGLAYERWRRNAQVAIISATSRLLQYWPGDRLGFGGRQPRGVMRDWAWEARHGRYSLRGDKTDYESALGQVTQPLLLVDISGDPMIPAAAVDHLARRLPVHAVRASVIAGDTHHFRWARRRPELVIATIERWLHDNDLR